LTDQNVTAPDSGVGQSFVDTGGRMLHLQLTGCVKLWAGERALATRPHLRKATAILAILALTTEHEIDRRQLARLLWSRNSVSQGLARLRDTLHRLRRVLQTIVPELEVLQLERDRVVLHRDRVWIDVFEPVSFSRTAFAAEDIASDLSGIDPSLDAWLVTARARLLLRLAAKQPPHAAIPARKRNGPTIGVYRLSAIGIGIDPYLTVALASELTAALAAIRWLVVLPSATMAALREAGGNARSELGLDFALEGTLQRVGNRIRVRIALIDVEQGAVAWSWRSVFDTHDMLAVQEDAAAMAAAAVEPEIAICEANRARRLGHTGKGAYGLVLKATSCMYRMDHDSFLEGGRLIEEAIEAEPYYGAAHAWLALWNVFLVGQGWAREPAHSIAGAELAAERAILLDPGDARGLAVAGHVQAYLYRRLDTAISIHERAVTVNPNLPIAWQLGGVAHAYAGNLAEAGQFLERSRRLAPCDPHTFFQDGCCVILQLISGKFEEARATGRRVTQLHPRFSASFKPYLAALGHLGDTVAAAEVYRKLLVLEPHFSLSTFEASAPFAQAEHMDIYLSGLRLAGVT
jgi:TolB-like protein